MTFRSRVLRPAPILLVVFTLCYLGLAWLYVPRLVNCIWTDVEFTGWIGPLASRLGEGDRVYRDFTLPIPPGSFIILHAIQALAGRVHIAHDLWVIALCQLGMVWVGYWLLRPFVAAHVAAMAAVATAPILIATPKEIAYDQTAQLVAWSALAVLAHALTAPADRRRRRLLFFAGLLSALTLLFKSSTGVGATGGALLALGFVTAIAARQEGRTGLRGHARDWEALGLGIASGAIATVVTVLIMGGDLIEFFRIVFVDGPALKGGLLRALRNLLSYVGVQTPMRLTLLAAILLAYVVLRRGKDRPPEFGIVARDSSQGSGDRRRGAWSLAVAAAAVLVAYLTAMTLLWLDVSRVPVALRFVGEYSASPLMVGVLLLLGLWVASARSAGNARDSQAVFAAIVLAAMVQTLAHNLSAPQLRLFKDNNVIIPLALGALIHILDRARSYVLKYAAFALLLCALFSGKLQRQLEAKHPVSEPGSWQGMQVSRYGLTVLRAAVRARELAGPTGTVLVLPEDLMFEALIDRPRPKLFGAAVFVDQFPERLLERDLDTLWAKPPDVLILHPRDPDAWKRFYRYWQTRAPAERFQDEFVASRLESDYRLDSSYTLKFFEGRAELDVYARIAPRE